MELIPLDDVKEQLEKYRSNVEEVLSYTKKLSVTNKREAQESINYIARARSLSEQINKTKLSLTKNARDYVTRINNIAKDFSEPLDLIEDTVLSKIDGWKASFDETIAELESETFLDSTDFVEAFEVTDKFRTHEASAYESTEYSYEVEDISKVPQQYLAVDKLNFDLAMKAGIRKIPGLKITQKTVTKVRRNCAAKFELRVNNFKSEYQNV
jgi:hypothetical protein